MATINDLIQTIKSDLAKNVPLVDQLPTLLSYKGTDWQTHVSFCEKRYKRTLVYKDDDIEVLIICWNVNQHSGIHDHPENGCIVKVLDGSLQELVYMRTDNGIGTMELAKTNTMDKNDVSYQRGSDGLHDIVNGSVVAVSLHVYSPPNYVPHFF